MSVPPEMPPGLPNPDDFKYARGFRVDMLDDDNYVVTMTFPGYEVVVERAPDGSGDRPVERQKRIQNTATSRAEVVEKFHAWANQLSTLAIADASAPPQEN